MVTWLYFITFAASAGLMVFYVYKNKRVESCYILFCLTLTVNSLGRWMLSVSDTMEQAIWANAIMYFGSCYTPYLYLLILARLSNLKVPRRMQVLMVSMAAIVYGFALTVGHNDLYYSKLRLVQYDGYAYLDKVYGPAHWLYLIMIVFYLGYILVILVQAFRKRRTIAYGTVVVMSVLGFAVMMTYLLTRIMKSRVEWLSIGYLIGVVVVTQTFEKINMYDMSTNIAVSVAVAKENGYIVYDNKKRYMNSNELIRQLYPEINDWQVSANPPRSGGIFGEKIITWFLSNDSITEHKTLRVDNRFFEIAVREIRYGRKNQKIGYLMEAIDRTAEHNYTVSVEKYKDELESEVAEQIRIIRTQNRRNEQLLSQTVFALANAVDAKDNYTSGHSKRVAEYARLIARRMGKTAEAQEEIYRAGLLHDVGKIRIPEDIINKPGKLTDDEYTMMKLHPITGYHILKGVSSERIFADGARFHHERYDGKGYPIGLVGDQIPEIARIIGVADAYDAMASRRSYRSTMTQAAVRAEIAKGRGTQFDPDIAGIMLQLIDEDVDYTLRQTAPVRKRILAVDDDPMNIKLIGFSLKDIDYYSVTGAESGSEAIELLHREHFDIAFIDIRMLDMDGYQTAERIRQFSDIPIILMTADRKSIDGNELRRYAITDFISKPFIPAVLKEILHATLAE